MTWALFLFVGLMIAPILRRLVSGGRPANGQYVDLDDPALLAAQARARAGLDAFLHRLARPQPGDAEFAVKFRLRGGGQSEQIWAEGLSLRAGQLTGRLANDPVVPGHAFDELVTIDRADILDWGYRARGVMQGHATTRHFLKDMPSDLAANLRRDFGWV